jgi:glucosamine--fructose-6-phosphate aminotransferase (isomerizing)
MPTQMEQETAQTPELVAMAFKQNDALFQEISRRLSHEKLQFVVTVARGSSDHAALFAKYLIETQLKLITASFSPSIETIYHAKLNLKNSLTIAVSQSGKSPDLCESLQATRQSGSIALAFVNKTDSPLAKIADYVVPLWAGEEKAVAATKSYITSLSNLIHFVARLSNDQALLDCLRQLPEQLDQALNLDWSPAIAALAGKPDALIVGRGYGYPIACEAALKCKETAGIHAEAFSSAEILHGPFALVGKDYPVLIFTQQDAALKSTLELAQKCLSIGAKPLVAAPETLALPAGILRLPTPEFSHPICDPLKSILCFYKMVAALAVKRGYNPDKPPHLNKVTETL